MNVENKLALYADDMAKLNSKDESTKVGAIITDMKHKILTLGYNGMPRNLNDHARNRNDRTYQIEGRPIKYSWAEHAERNAIYNIARNNNIFKGKVLLVNTELDVEDVRAIVSAGINKFIVVSESGNLFSNKDGENIALEMLAETMISYIVFEKEQLLQLPSEELKYDLLNSGFSMKHTKLIKKLELLDIQSKYFAENHVLKTPADKVFSTIKGSSVIFDEQDLNDLSIESTGVIAGLKDDFKGEILEVDTLSAVRNVIYSAISPYLKDTAIFVNLCPCIDCAKAIAATSIKKAYYLTELNANVELMERWKKSFDATEKYFNKVNVKMFPVKK